MIRANTGKPSDARTEAARTRILDAAWRLFAEDGLEVPLARIARAARVTPNVLRRCFGSKKALVDRVFEKLFAGRWKPEWDALLANRALPLETRLAQFYVEYRGNIERNGARLWTRAGLLGLHPPGSLSRTLAERIFRPIVRELRHEAGLSALPELASSGEELELAMVLHAAIAFPHTRAHIFAMDVHGTLAELVPMIVRVWLPGAKAEIRRLAALRATKGPAAPQPA